jgi:hypothetical protein
MSTTGTFLLASVAVLAMAAPAAVTAEQTKADASGVTVTVKYTGKGTVDATHQLWVWLFDTPEIGAGSIPVAEQSIAKNGGTATFSSVTAKQVYVAVAYDEAGGFGGQAPPPPGSPIALFGSKGPDAPPQAVVPGPKAALTITLDDAIRMP